MLSATTWSSRKRHRHSSRPQGATRSSSGWPPLRDRRHLERPARALRERSTTKEHWREASGGPLRRLREVSQTIRDASDAAGLGRASRRHTSHHHGDRAEFVAAWRLRRRLRSLPSVERRSMPSTTSTVAVGHLVATQEVGSFEVDCGAETGGTCSGAGLVRSQVRGPLERRTARLSCRPALPRRRQSQLRSPKLLQVARGRNCRTRGFPSCGRERRCGDGGVLLAQSGVSELRNDWPTPYLRPQCSMVLRR